MKNKFHCLITILLLLFLVKSDVLLEGSTDFKAVIFDCDGTLVDNGTAFYLEWHHAMQQQGYELPADDFWNFLHKHQFVGAARADEGIVRHCCELLGYDCAEELLRDKRAFSSELHKKGFPPIAPTISFLRELSMKKEELGLKIGLASAGGKDHIMRTLRQLGIEELFDIIISGADDLSDYEDPAGTNKPKPYVYIHAAKMLGAAPDECIAIEDSRPGVTSAVTAGCFTVAIPNQQTIHHDLSHAHLKISSFANISPQDLLQTAKSLTTETR